MVLDATHCLSVGVLSRHGFEVHLTGVFLHISKKSMNFMAKVCHDKTSNLFMVAWPSHVVPFSAFQTSAVPSNKALCYHRRFNHICESRLRVVNDKLALAIPPSHFKNMPFCETCVMGKSTKSRKTQTKLPQPVKPVPNKTKPRSFKVFGKIAMDTVGPVSPMSLNGDTYAVVTMCYTSHYIDFFPIRNRGEAWLALKHVVEDIAIPNGHRIMVVKSDGAQEYKHGKFKTYCEAKGITREMSTPRVSTQNPRAERSIRTIGDKIRCAMANYGSPDSLWHYAGKHAAMVDSLATDF